MSEILAGIIIIFMIAIVVLIFVPIFPGINCTGEGKYFAVATGKLNPFARCCYSLKAEAPAGGYVGGMRCVQSWDTGDRRSCSEDVDCPFGYFCQPDPIILDTGVVGEIGICRVEGFKCSVSEYPICCSNPDILEAQIQVLCGYLCPNGCE